MTDQRKKEIADHYMEAINREDLHTGEAARYLNLNPCYLSMVKIEKHWSSMSQAAWDRLGEWHDSRCKISEFVIPEMEIHTGQIKTLREYIDAVNEELLGEDLRKVIFFQRNYYKP